MTDLRNQGILVKMNLFLQYAVRCLRALDSAINAIPSDLRSSTRTRMLQPPSEPLKTMLTITTAVTTFLTDIRGTKQWSGTSIKLKDWGSGLFDEPFPLDRYLTHGHLPGTFKDVCAAFAKFFAILVGIC